MSDWMYKMVRMLILILIGFVSVVLFSLLYVYGKKDYMTNL